MDQNDRALRRPPVRCTLIATLVAATACTSTPPPVASPKPSAQSTHAILSPALASASVAPTLTAPIPSPNASPEARLIEQPPVPDIPGLAPDAKRVDLVLPTFSDPTEITNPLFPVSRQESVLFVGHVDGKPFRTEVTLLPQTRIGELEGMQVETAVSQYFAYLD